MKSWRTDDESSRGTDLTATRTELNNMSASGAAPFRKHGRKYLAISVLFFQAVRTFHVIRGLAAGQAVQQLISMPSSTGNATLT